ncbi:hypothetical protein DRQ53_15135 [bacterium]|nr:MAG: hypothetical protein DRQ53_15135 [bacterium]
MNFEISAVADLHEEMMRRCRELDAALDRMVVDARAYAMADANHKKNRAVAYLESDGTVSKREADADIATAKSRYESLLAEALWRSSQLAVRSRQSQISALQTLAGAMRAEAEFARTGPEV